MNVLRCVKGMHDILPDEMPGWHFVERAYREVVERYGYEEIRTPILEPLELFVRGIGEATDIVEKEMYAFEDKGGDWLALRPEGTASAIRAYVQHNLHARSPLHKLWYIGPMFRRERPAKGRFRQFYQAGAELIGAAEPSADAELVEMAVRYVENLGITGVNVHLSSLGDADTRPGFRAALRDHFGGVAGDLCDDCRRRLETNPLRILDCKVESCHAHAAKAPSVLEHISGEAREHFDETRRLLDLARIAAVVDPTMVRGLDYYTRTIFEIKGAADALGAQATIVGGGRYNDLVAEFGGPATPAIGFSFGIERLLMLLDAGRIPAARPVVFVAGIGEGGGERARAAARDLRAGGFRVEVGYAEGSLRSQLKKADRAGAAVVVIAGEDEASRGAVTVREMAGGGQREIAIAGLAAALEAYR